VDLRCSNILSSGHICNNYIEPTITIDEEVVKTSSSRKFCYCCSPFKQKSTLSLSTRKSIKNSNLTKKRIYYKFELIMKLGGKCSKCSYDQNIAALEFHHLDNNYKKFELSVKSMSRPKEEIEEELSKCILLCSNCHKELHNYSYEKNLVMNSYNFDQFSQGKTLPSLPLK
jgi:hypothetical protein